MTKNIEDYYAPWVKGIPMYISEHIELAWRKPELHRMMSNENPLPPSDKVLEAMFKYAKMTNRYPDQGLIVRSKIAEINNVDGPQNVMIGNGSSEVYDNIFRMFIVPGDEVIQHTPCFGIYGCAEIARRKNGQRADDLQGSLPALRPRWSPERRHRQDQDHRHPNPNNPSGNFMDPQHFEPFAKLGIPLVVDEAYIEYAGLGMSQVELTKKYKNVFITRTLSKAYGLAGMRFGYTIAHEDTLKQVAGSLLPWNVGTIPMWAALAAFEDTEGLAERVKFNNDAVSYISESLSVIPGFYVMPSKSNYILFDCGETGKTGKEVLAYAETKGIILRGESKKYGSDGWFRVTIGSKEENELFVNTVLEFFGVKK
jgi:histidinol-phosphate aminotransferase